MGMNEGLYPITIRFTADGMDAISRIAELQEKSKAEIVRLAVDNHLVNYLKKCVFLSPEDAGKVMSVLGDVLSEMQSIKGELRRIGINYNRALKLKEIDRKLKERAIDTSTMLRLFDEKKELEEEEDPLEPEKLEELMARYEAATKEAGEILCRILG